ncbi:hypothetical protein [Polynucleobacter sp. es-MAR-4]|nr:hypothetical protein [Polynucleobacter sp. es-MAR-4]MBU3637359.1 hypothetical protein [Polynucleobacter sp. es-MAR-4]
MKPNTPSPEVLQKRAEFNAGITQRMNHLYLRAKLTTGTQKQRKTFNPSI